MLVASWCSPSKCRGQNRNVAPAIRNGGYGAMIWIPLENKWIMKGCRGWPSGISEREVIPRSWREVAPSLGQAVVVRQASI